jgi:hypothetical protein
MRAWGRDGETEVPYLYQTATPWGARPLMVLGVREGAVVALRGRSARWHGGGVGGLMCRWSVRCWPVGGRDTPQLGLLRVGRERVRPDVGVGQGVDTCVFATAVGLAAAGWLAASEAGVADPPHPDSRTNAEQAASNDTRGFVR